MFRNSGPHGTITICIPEQEAIWLMRSVRASSVVDSGFQSCGIRRAGFGRTCRFQSFAVMASVCLMSGCTLLPIRNLRPVIAPPAGASTCSDSHAFLPNESIAENRVQYVAPGDAAGEHRMVIEATNSFEAYRAAIQKRVKAKLPPAIADHRVTTAFVELLTAASAEAQLDAQAAGKKLEANVVNAERDSIQKHSNFRNLKHSELKDFATKLFDLQLRHGPADFTGADTDLARLSPSASKLASTRPKLGPEFVAYLKAYYDGKFYDRMSTAISKPQLPSGLSGLSNFSVPDSEIVAAETVLLEFLIDCVDPTPVMGDKDGHPAGTTYYPGNSSNEPTVLATNFAAYVTLPADGCGINLKNVWVLKDLANAASDQATAVGGLIVNTPGGISFGLGVLGKISIGDNQTLSDIVKSAASEMALRATLAATYFTLRNINFNPIQP